MTPFHQNANMLEQTNRQENIKRQSNEIPLKVATLTAGNNLSGILLFIRTSTTYSWTYSDVINKLFITYFPMRIILKCIEIQIEKEAQWLNGRVLDPGPRDRGFESHRRHRVESLNKNIYPSLVLVQPRKTCPA